MVFSDTLMYSEDVVTVTMSEYSTPMSVAFDFQRSAVESTHEAIESGVEAQKQLNDAMVDGFGPARDASERSTDLVRSGIDSYFDAVDSVMPAGSGVDEVHEMMHDQLDMLEESQHEAIDQLENSLNEGTESAEEMLDEFLAALGDQIESLLEAHEDFEGQTLDALEELEETVEEMQSEVEARGEEMQEQLESQAEAIQEQLEDVTENVQEAATETADLSA
jgi:DNA repair exonuclease SbcCD ATPase subunit